PRSVREDAAQRWSSRFRRAPPNSTKCLVSSAYFRTPPADRLQDVLHLLANFFELHFRLDDVRLRGRVLDLGADGIELSSDLLEQEIELFPVGRGSHSVRELGKMTLEAHEFLGHVDLVAQERNFGGDALRVREYLGRHFLEPRVEPPPQLLRRCRGLGFDS